MVENHYLDLGFTPLDDGNTSRYVLYIDDYHERECHIKQIL